MIWIKKSDRKKTCLEYFLLLQQKRQDAVSFLHPLQLHVWQHKSYTTGIPSSRYEWLCKRVGVALQATVETLYEKQNTEVCGVLFLIQSLNGCL